MKMRFPLLGILLAAAFASGPAWADVVLSSIISDHMVLQKTPKARIWGKADPGEKVSVTLDKLTGDATTGADGKWALELNLSESKPGPFEMVVQGKNRIAVADVAVGEVWVASGQSNMAFDMDGEIAAKEEIPASAHPLLRNSPRSELEGFSICGEDRKWVWADAKIEGDTVLVWSDQVAQPVAVRYAWDTNPACNLYNGAGFPASPFRTDAFPVSTQNAQ